MIEIQAFLSVVVDLPAELVSLKQLYLSSLSQSSMRLKRIFSFQGKSVLPHLNGLQQNGMSSSNRYVFIKKGNKISEWFHELL